MELLQAIEARRSVRGFRPDPVPRDVLVRLFAAAQRAPSWCNIQPWRAWVATGAAKDRFIRAQLAAFESGAPHPDVPFPAEYPPPYDAHRRECGKALYQAMGVERGDAAGKLHAWVRNFHAFDAPVVALVGVDRRFGLYAALDVGCWLQTLLLAATAEGLATCAQAALATYPSVARAELGVPEDVAILFGVAIGWEDPSVAANACRTTRAPIGDNVTFVDA